MNPDIAVIDSGVNPDHFHVQKISGGHGVVMNSKGNIEKTSDFMDEIGHGTAICGIIRQKAAFADLYAIKIFHHDLTAPVRCLIEALAWAIDKPFKIIHLSLGVKDEIIGRDLEHLCLKAHDKNIVVLASAKGPYDKTYPACFKTVIGVYWHQDAGFDQMVFHRDAEIEFGAHGWPRQIPGMPQEQNFRGSSFALAHVTARVAQL
ncbi:MAG: S8 family serine peptidase, partial [Proteobacteria bacterium]|nr:S8 family serine peptidase [Pseudomonadota bacterium]